MPGEILKLIENVDPEDIDAMDEIDARVWCWRGNLPFVKIYRCQETFKNRLVCIDTLADGSKKEQTMPILSHVTRSRDALKAIRPGGVVYKCISDNTGF